MHALLHTLHHRLTRWAAAALAAAALLFTEAAAALWPLL